MSNYYISKCCGSQVNKTLTGFWNCQKCGQRCEVTAVIDTPGGMPEATTANANNLLI